MCRSALVIARALDTNYRTGSAEGSGVMRTNLIRRERKIGYRLVSVIRCGNFCYNATTMGLSLNERILSTAIVRHCYCRFLAASDTERPSSRNPAHANSSEFSSVLDANQGFKTSQNSPGISLIASAPLGSEKRFVWHSYYRVLQLHF